MYAPSTASTTSGSGVTRDVVGDRRVRMVRLVRPRRPCPTFGFSLRGGREHTTGFFISKVELNSEAHHQGLKVGDQLVSVNGYRVDDAVHSELAHYLSTQTRLKFKVRNVGMIPVKDKSHEPLSWHFISDRASVSSGASSSPTLCHTQRLQDLRLSILVPPRAKLGCGICKGPEWKPGIFVQFVRENGIAREAGLRPGDQILACNGQDFANVTFNDAIAAMKESGRLELLVREGAGVELVSPESSGYNSSTSSAAGERMPASPAPPPAALRRRLASVAEEAADRVDRLTGNRLKRRTWDSLDFEWKNVHNFDAPSDIEPDYDSPSIPNNPHTYENQIKDFKNKDFVTNPSNRTIINLTENGATIECNYENQSPRKTTYSSSQYQTNGEDKKTIVVEVHHSKCTQQNSSKSRSKTLDLSDTSSLSSSTTLSSAIAEEILKRKLKKKESNNDENNVTTNILKKTTVTKTVENEKKKQHDALMDEFKKVHRKMFANQEIKIEAAAENDVLLSVDADRQPTLPIRKSTNSSNGCANENSTTRKMGAERPPPPPPMPVSNGAAVNGNCTENQTKIDKDHNECNHRNSTLNRIPTPDYSNNKIVMSPLKNSKVSMKDDAADIESLESYKLKNPCLSQPKPPPTYFVRAPNGTATMKKHGRPVSVTIGEYPGSGIRKEPSKLEFLGNEKPNEVDVTDSAPITNRFQSELALTLSRSNLRKKTDSLEKTNNLITQYQDTANSEDSFESLDKNFHLRYGNNILPLPPCVTIPKVTGIKSVSLHNKTVPQQ